MGLLLLTVYYIAGLGATYFIMCNEPRPRDTYVPPIFLGQVSVPRERDLPS